MGKATAKARRHEVSQPFDSLRLSGQKSLPPKTLPRNRLFSYFSFLPIHRTEIAQTTMKKIFIISIFAIGILISGVALIFYYEFGDMIRQIHAGQRYMDSLSIDNRSEWIARTTVLLDTYRATNNYEFDRIQIYGSDIPEELVKLKILGVDVWKDEVRYIWAGGLEHTYLSVQRTPEGNFRFFANYNDEHSEELWP